MKKLLITTLIVGALAGSAFAQGLVALSGKAYYNTTLPTGIGVSGATTGTAVPVGSIASIPGYGSLNVCLVWGSTNVTSGGLFGATTASRLTSDWIQALGVAQKTGPTAGTLGSFTFTVGPGSPEQTFLVGWTGTYQTWNAAFDALLTAPAGSILMGWSGLGGNGSLGWSQANALPPNQPTPIVSGAAGFNGLVLQPYLIPEPSMFALAGLGAAALMIFRRRK